MYLDCFVHSHLNLVLVMLPSPTRRPSSTDLSFFSASKVSKAVASSSSNVVVTTRITRRPLPQRSFSATTSANSLPRHPPSSPSSITSSPLSSPPASSRKRKSLSSALPQGPSDLPREVKRLRTSSAKERPGKRKPAHSSNSSSRSASRNASLAPPSPQPIYRTSRSRSTSLFPGLDSDSPTAPRRWRTDEDGAPGEHYLSSEVVVKRLMKSYKACKLPVPSPLPSTIHPPPDFKNPNDPNDTSFKPHPTDYPVVELEYPNTRAIER